MNPDDRYEPPRVEELPDEDGPVVTAAGDCPITPGVEWRPADGDRDDYESPQVEELPAEEAPARTAAGLTGPQDDGPEWRAEPPAEDD
jgi:hypothetical protein